MCFTCLSTSELNSRFAEHTTVNCEETHWKRQYSLLYLLYILLHSLLFFSGQQLLPTTSFVNSIYTYGHLQVLHGGISLILNSFRLISPVLLIQLPKSLACIKSREPHGPCHQQNDLSHCEDQVYICTSSTTTTTRDAKAASPGPSHHKICSIRALHLAHYGYIDCRHENDHPEHHNARTAEDLCTQLTSAPLGECCCFLFYHGYISTST